MNSNNKKLEKRVLNNNPKFKGRKYLSHSKTYEEYKKLIEEGLTQIEIAREIGKSPSAIHQYINRHPELPRPIKGKGGQPINSERYNLIRDLSLEGKSQSEIAREIGKSPSAIHQYINRHPELPRPIKHSKLRKIYDSNKSKK